jgi:peptide/nickel transport system permease protein
VLGFLIGRLAWAAMLFFVVTLYTYVLFFLIGPTSANIGNRSAGESGEAVSVAESVGVDGSFFGAYADFLRNVVTGDLGQSFYSRQDVTEIISAAAPVTGSLIVGAAVMWLLIAFPIGVLSALKPRSLLDRAGMVFVLIGISAHPLWVGYILSYVFGYKLGIFPINGYCDVFNAATSCGGPVQWAYHLLLPWFTFALAFAAIYARMIRASLKETLSEDYIRTARAKGLGTWPTVRTHALRNALLPIVTMLGMDLGLAFVAAVFVERAYSLPGIGSLLFTALGRHDTPVILGIVILVTTAIIVFNLVVDLVYGLLDPRVRTTSRRARHAETSTEAPSSTGAPQPASVTST